MAALLASVVLGCRPAEDVDRPTPPVDKPATFDASHGPQPIDDARLHNAFRLHERVISGAQPDEAAFAALWELGVQTIISVDGATPDVATARKYGLRYVHLPHGYDGISPQRVQELARAVTELPGPVFIHCHHGKHRSPAAAAAACVAAGLIGREQARATLAAAGTSGHYTGLFQAVEEAQRLDTALLEALQVEYRETAQIPPLAEAMVAIEHTFDHLEQCAAADWHSPPDHPDIDPPHEALMLAEHYRELGRTQDVRERAEGFRGLLAAGEHQATALERGLRRWFEAGCPQPPPRELATAWGWIGANCRACHLQYRDVPQAN